MPAHSARLMRGRSTAMRKTRAPRTTLVSNGSLLTRSISHSRDSRAAGGNPFGDDEEDEPVAAPVAAATAGVFKKSSVRKVASAESNPFDDEEDEPQPKPTGAPLFIL